MPRGEQERPQDQGQLSDQGIPAGLPELSQLLSGADLRDMVAPSAPEYGLLEPDLRPSGAIQPEQVQLVDTTGANLPQPIPDRHQRKMDISTTVGHATSVGRQVEDMTQPKRTLLDRARILYDLGAEAMYHPEWYLRGILGLMTSTDSAKRSGGYFWAQDMLRTVFEGHFPEFQGKVKGSLRKAADVVKFFAPALQFIGDVDAIGDVVMTLVDASEGKSLSRLGLDAALTAVDLVPPPFSVVAVGDVALFSPGLDKSERVLQYSLMEALFLGMTDPKSPLFQQRDAIARAVLDTKSFVATAANATLLNEEKSLGAKMGRLTVDDKGDVYLKIAGPIKFKLTRDGKKPGATTPYATQLQQHNPRFAQERYAELSAKAAATGLTNDETMQLAMCNLIVHAEKVLGREARVVEAPARRSLAEPQSTE